MKEKRSKLALSILCLISIVAMSLLGIRAGAQEKTFALKYADGHPPGLWNSSHQPKYLKAIEKATNDRVKTTYFGGGALLPAKEIYAGVVAGTTDMGEGMLAYYPGRFPLMAMLEQPGIPYNNCRVAAYVATDLLNKFNPKELSDVKVLYFYSTGPAVFMTKKPVHNLADLKGLRMRSSGTTAETVQALGASPIAMPNPEIYISLQKGILDGALTAAADIKAMKFYEVIKYVTIHPLGSGSSVAAMVMNLQKWNSLLPDIQKAITEVSEQYCEISIGIWEKNQSESLQEVKKLGVEVISLSPEENAKWQEIVKPVMQKYIDSIEAMGLPGKNVFSYIMERTEYWDKKYPSRFGM